MDIEIKLEGVQEMIRKLQAAPEAVKKATAFTINEAIKAGKSAAAKEVVKDYNIKQTIFRERLKITLRATENNLAGVLTAKGRGMPLSVFDVRQQGFYVRRAGPKGSKEKYLVRNKRRRGAVTSLVKKAAGRKVEEGRYGNKPFLATNQQGRLVVWERKGKEKYPVGEHWGPGLAKLIEKDAIQKKIKESILKRFYEKILRNIAYFMGKTGGSPPPESV